MTRLLIGTQCSLAPGMNLYLGTDKITLLPCYSFVLTETSADAGAGAADAMLQQ